jgi:hypothetical protein
MRGGVVDHVAGSEQAEAMQGRQRGVTGACALSLPVTTEGRTGIFLRWIQVVIIVLLVLFLINVMVTLGEVLGGGSRR